MALLVYALSNGICMLYETDMPAVHVSTDNDPPSGREPANDYLRW